MSVDFLNYFSNKLEKVSPRYKSMNVNMKDIPTGLKIPSAILIAAELAACANGYIAPTISTEPGNNQDGGIPFGLIPTPDKKESLNDSFYQTEIYSADDKNVCIFHQFNSDGQAVAPRAFTNCEINFDLDNNTVIATGDSFIKADSEVVIYPEHDGQKGYESLQVMNIADAITWMNGMNLTEEEYANTQKVIDEATRKGVDVRILMKTVLNVQKDSNNEDKLVNMALGIAMSAGGEGATIAQLNDSLNPLTEDDLLKNQQIAAVDFAPQFDGSEKLVMEVYPGDWKEIGGGQYVSPEFIVVQDEIAASGEKFTLMPDGTIQEKTEDGVKTVTGLSVDKKGQRTLLINGEKIVIESTNITINDQDGIKINGYTQNATTGEWESAESQLPAGTMIPVEAKNIAEASANFMTLDAEGNGTITIDGQVLPYHSKDTIFKIAGSPDLLVIAGWEYKLVNGSYEYQGPRVFTVADYNSKTENPNAYIPTINEKDTDLLAKYWDQTKNPNLFNELAKRLDKDSTINRLQPDHWRFNKRSDSKGDLMYLNPIDEDPNKFRLMKPVSPIYPYFDGPMIKVGNIGISFPVYILNNSETNDVVITNGIFGFGVNDFSNVSDNLDGDFFYSLLRSLDIDSGNKNYEGELYSFIAKNSETFLSTYTINDLIPEFDKKILSKTFFLLQRQEK